MKAPIKPWRGEEKGGEETRGNEDSACGGVRSVARSRETYYTCN